MEYRFYLNDLEIDEPGGWADLELSLIRDDKFHGIGREASLGSLDFYGEAFDYLVTQYDTYKLAADVVFTAEQRCEGGTEWEELVSGQLNFGKYRKTCGLVCSVSIPMEEKSCELVLRSRADQKVDVDKVLSNNNLSGLTPYSGLGLELYLPPKALNGRVQGYVVEDGDPITIGLITDVPGGNNFYLFRPTYGDERANSISTGQLVPASYYQQISEGDLGLPISPVLLFEGNSGCFDTPLNFETRMKGTYRVGESSLSKILNLLIVRWDGDGTIWPPTPDYTVVASVSLFSGAYTANDEIEFDGSYSGSITLNEGEALYILLEVQGGESFNQECYVRFDPETYVDIVGEKLCVGSDSDVYMVHELLSRVTESITDNCIRAKSSFYGRTDSQPFAFDEDGCGGLRCFTSGLKIRRAKEPNFFISFKELIEGLNAIDCIGYDVIPDPDVDGNYLVRIEDARYFYQDTELLNLSDIPNIESAVIESKCYAQVDIGFKKWETDEANGLAEMHSTRTYRTSLKTVNNRLDVTSNLVAGAYPLELTRTSQYGDTQGKDSTYDNEAFILCLARNAYGFEVERDNIANPENIFSPETQYNYRITPARNMMRWYKIAANVYGKLGDTSNRLAFTAGTGNLTAKGEIWGSAYEFCKIEGQAIAENQDIFITQFASAADYTPIYDNVDVQFEYPLSVEEYKRIKENPYGYITFKCGNQSRRGYIKEIKWKPEAGLATFILKQKWTVAEAEETEEEKPYVPSPQPDEEEGIFAMEFGDEFA